MARNRGRHRRPSTSSTVALNAKRAGAVGLATVATAPLALFTDPGVATASTYADWDRLAGCESSNRWDINTGNGFFGGLQFTQETWRAAGGTEFAPRADLATREQQIQVAAKWLERVAEEQGLSNAWASQWPACSAKLGLRNTPAKLMDAAPPAPTPPPAPAPAPSPAPAPAPPAPIGEPAVSVTTSDGVTGEEVATQARLYAGRPYEWGGESMAEGGYDCSGFVAAVYNSLGFDLGRPTSRDFAKLGTEVASIDEAKAGDVGVYDTNGDGVINHVAIFLGNGRMIDARGERTGVSERDLSTNGLITIRRLVDNPDTSPIAIPEPVEEAVTEPVEPTVVPETDAEPTADGRVYGEFTHTVAPGDWISTIAQDRGVCGPDDDIKTCWEDFARQNGDVAPNPYLIYPGQKLKYAGLLLPNAPLPVVDAYEEATTGEAPAPEAAPAPPPAPAPAPEPEPEPEAAPVNATAAHPVPGVGVNSLFRSASRPDHQGVDLAAPLGTPIYAAVGGEVISSGSASGFGNWIRIRSDNNVVYVYGHMRSQDLLVDVGDVVKAGDMISRVGSEGQSTGPHLHFEVRPNGGAAVNPIGHMASLGVTLFLR